MLLTCRPLAGHYEPLVGLARALARAGHAVAFATGRGLLERPRAAGFEAFEAGPPETLVPAVAHRMPAPDVLATDAGRAWFFREVFAGLELEPRAADLDRVLAAWRPDLVVHEVAELAGPLAAAAANVPWATCSFGPLAARAVLLAAGAAVAPHWERRGRVPDPYAGVGRLLYLDVCPPRLQVAWARELPAVQPMRAAAAPSDPRAVAPRRGDGARGTVYVTFGTVWNRDPAPFAAVLDALAGDPLDLVVTVGDRIDPAALGPRPPSVRVAAFIAQAEVLPHCDAVVCHGGAGTVLGALGHGRPLVVLPQGADQFANGERVVAAGAGVMLLHDERTPGALRDAVRAVLGDPAHRRAAAAIAAEIAAMPEPAAAIPALESLARA